MIKLYRINGKYDDKEKNISSPPLFQSEKNSFSHLSKSRYSELQPLDAFS